MLELLVVKAIGGVTYSVNIPASLPFPTTMHPPPVHSILCYGSPNDAGMLVVLLSCPPSIATAPIHDLCLKVGSMWHLTPSHVT